MTLSCHPIEVGGVAIRCFFVQLGGYMKGRSRSGGDEVFKGSCYEPCTRKNVLSGRNLCSWGAGLTSWSWRICVLNPQDSTPPSLDHLSGSALDH